MWTDDLEVKMFTPSSLIPQNYLYCHLTIHLSIKWCFSDKKSFLFAVGGSSTSIFLCLSIYLAIYLHIYTYLSIYAYLSFDPSIYIIYVSISVNLSSSYNSKRGVEPLLCRYVLNLELFFYGSVPLTNLLVSHIWKICMYISTFE